MLRVSLLSSSPHCHETDDRGAVSPGWPESVDPGRLHTRAGPTPRSVLYSFGFPFSSLFRSLRDQPFATLRGPLCPPTGTRTGSSTTCLCARLSAFELLCGATDIQRGGAGSTRWIALLGRACRRHRQLLSTRGSGVTHCLCVQYLPSRHPWEPPSNRPFAKRLVMGPGQRRFRPGRRRAHPWLEPPATS